ncbi:MULTISPECIES: TauD/TfdA family dioxygenase [Dyella]|nr:MULTISPECIES: TauD/TfdA family dioxygenase [Dyella]
MPPIASTDAVPEPESGHADDPPAPGFRGSLTVQLAERRPFGLIVTPGQARSSIFDIPTHLSRAWVRRYRVVVLRGFRHGLGEPPSLASFTAQWLGETSSQQISIQHVTPLTRHRALDWAGDDHPSAPEFVLFACQETATTPRCCTRFVDASAIALQLDEATFHRWLGVSISESRDHGVHDGVASWPLLVTDPRDGAPVVRYKWLPPGLDGLPREPWLHGADDEAASPIRRLLHGILRLPVYHFVHGWEDGDVLIADNWRLLHGHDAWRSDADTQLWRAHVTR